jgi:F0F1-type ATP synthase membrane subunit b/b'
MGALVYFLRKPLALFFEVRSSDIRKAIEEAKAAKAESEARLRDYETRLKTLDREIADMKAEFAKQGEIERAQLKQAAEAMAKQIAQDAEDMIAAELHHAEVALKRQLADSVIELATKNVAEQMNRQLGLRMQNAFVLDIGDVKH